MAPRQPTATERPSMPGYGIDRGHAGLLPWSWATERLRTAHGYWIATTDADGGPHLATVWGVWFDDAVCFSTGGRSRKARNLARDPRCSVTPGDTSESLMLHGTARRLTELATLERMRELYLAKYGEGFPDPTQNPVFAVTPVTAFGIVEAEFTTSATRWTFRD
jgi:Pyridoxamine 5'-phosphate oxidase